MRRFGLQVLAVVVAVVAFAALARMGVSIGGGASAPEGWRALLEAVRW